ncbi:MAG: AsmA family protein [Halioglobus sp.]|nr:AsmA family protein [Halioglobus sp.]
MPRKLLIALVVLALLLAAAALLLPRLVDRDALLERATTLIREQTGASLAVNGELDFTVFPRLALGVTQAEITLPERDEPDIKVGALQFGVQLWPLLTGEVKVDSIALSDVDLRVVGEADEERVDTASMSDAQLEDYYANRRSQREAAGRDAGAEAALALPLALNVSRLEIADTRIEITDPEGGPATRVIIEALAATGLNLEGTPIPVELTLQLPGEAPINVALEGDFSISLDAQEAELVDVEVAVSGALKEPLTLRLNGAVDLARLVADLQTSLSVGPTQGSGSVRYANFESPQIDASLDLNLLDPALLILAGPEAAAEAPAEDSGELPLDALRAIDTRAALRVATANFGAHKVENLELKLRAVDGTIDISTLRGSVHGGQLDARAKFDARLNTAQLTTSGAISGLDIARAVAATEATTELRGEADLNWQLVSSGRTTDELITGLNGPVKLATREVTLVGTNVEHMLCRTIALANQARLTAAFEPDTRFTTLSADIQLADGRAVLQPLRAELARLGLGGKGEYDLASGDLRARFKARLSPELEELDPACSVSKRLTAIDWPVDCRGNSAEDPAGWCSVDAEGILKELAVNKASKKIEKKAGKLLNKWLEKQN